MRPWTLMCVFVGLLLLGACQKSPPLVDADVAGTPPAHDARIVMRQVAEPSHAASTGAVPGGQRDVVRDRHGQVLHLVGQAIVTTADVLSVGQAVDGDGVPALSLRFHPHSGARIRQATEAAVGRRVAVLVDDEVITVATIAGPFGDAMQISGLEDHDQANRLFARMTGKAPVH